MLTSKFDIIIENIVNENIELPDEYRQLSKRMQEIDKELEPLRKQRDSEKDVKKQLEITAKMRPLNDEKWKLHRQRLEIYNKHMKK